MLSSCFQLFQILETPTLPALPRSTPQLPKFQEFHLETMNRANNKAETSTVASTDSAPQVRKFANTSVIIKFTNMVTR